VWWSATPYPEDQELARTRVRRVIDIIAARLDISDAEVVAQLVAEGVGAVDAQLLVWFVPCAVSIPVLKQMGLATFQYAYLVKTASGRVILRPLEPERYFTSALEWVDRLLALAPEARPLSLDAFWALVRRSPLFDAAERLKASSGPEALRGAAAGPLVLGITAEQIAASRPEPERPWWRFWG
jgi:hypothetical protein